MVGKGKQKIGADKERRFGRTRKHRFHWFEKNKQKLIERLVIIRKVRTLQNFITGCITQHPAFIYVFFL